MMLIHVVTPGESLWQIAGYYNVTIAKIMNTNQLPDPNGLVVGESLVIPTENIFHTVSSGETLWNIAQTYRTTIQAIAQANKITNLNNIYPGLTLYIKAPRYIIKTGDTLLRIAQSYGVTLQALLKVNDIQRPNIVSPGTVLIIPIKQRPVIYVNAYIYKLKELAAPIVMEDGKHLTYLSPFAYKIKEDGSLYQDHDYEAHGRIVDFVVLMTYEWGYRKGPPQAISPLNEIKRVLDYAVSVIPIERIYFGFQIYARDWILPFTPGGEAETFSNQEAIQRAVKNNAVIQYDSIAQSPFYHYIDKQGIMHEVWFEDARSAQAKFDIVKNYNLKGISYWALGYPFPQNWALLEDNFTIKKVT